MEWNFWDGIGWPLWASVAAISADIPFYYAERDKLCIVATAVEQHERHTGVENLAGWREGVGGIYGTILGKWLLIILVAVKWLLIYVQTNHSWLNLGARLVLILHVHMHSNAYLQQYDQRLVR